MKVFGLTGGIGMGKSAAGEWLQSRGLPLIDTDRLARQVVEPGQPAWEEIRREFGNDITDAEGRLRRDELARQVFGNAAARQKLESITHPRIRDLWRRQVDAWRSEQRSRAVVVIPLLFETGAESELDATVCIACSPATQQQRLADRGWTAEQIQQRIQAQWPIEKKIARADYVVWSEGDLSVLQEQLDRVFRVS
jgi:dephospho-CoA kinase